MGVALSVCAGLGALAAELVPVPDNVADAESAVEIAELAIDDSVSVNDDAGSVVSDIVEISGSEAWVRVLSRCPYGERVRGGPLIIQRG